MRAFYYPELNLEQEEYLLEGERFEHLKVVRLRIDEEVLLLNGQGHTVKAKLQNIGKKNASLLKISSRFEANISHQSVAIGIVKKDAFDLCIKMAVELGFKRIIPLESQYSQRYELNFERLQRLLAQALEQSNAAWMPEVTAPMKVSELVEKYENYSQIILMGMHLQEQNRENMKFNGEILGVIGPEGGFSAQEEKQLISAPNAMGLHLPTPILRTPTALGALAGVIFTKLELLD